MKDERGDAPEYSVTLRIDRFIVVGIIAFLILCASVVVAFVFDLPHLAGIIIFAVVLLLWIVIGKRKSK